MADNVPAVPVEQASLVNLIARAATDPAVDVGKLQALLDMQERVLRHQAKHAYNAAMARVAEEQEPVVRDAKNPHIGNKYAKLETIDAALRPIYSKHGFSIRYGSEPAADGRLHITCTVAHAGGHSETLGLSAPLDALGTGGRASKTGVQAVGSSITYLRRYLLSMALNIVTVDDDDDGEASRQVRRSEPPPRPEMASGTPHTPPPAEAPQWSLSDNGGLDEERFAVWFQRVSQRLDAATDEGIIYAIEHSDGYRHVIAKGSAAQRAKVTHLIAARRIELRRTALEAGGDDIAERIAEEGADHLQAG